MLLRLAYRNLVARRGLFFVALLAVAAAAFSAAGGTALVEGLGRTIGGTAQADVLVLLQRGADAEMASLLSRDAVSRAAARAGASAHCGELVSAILTQRPDGKVSNTLVRGVSACSIPFRPAFRVRAGRLPVRPDEALLGGRLVGRFSGLALGETVALPHGARATVVGTFEDGGAATESEIWVGYETAAPAFRREGHFSTALLRVPVDRQDGAREAVEHDRDLGYRLLSDAEFRSMQGHMTLLLVISLAVIVTAFVVLAGAAGAAAITMLSVSARAREIGVLRVIGFSRWTVLRSLGMELVILGLLGGTLGVGLAWPLRYLHFALLNTANFSEIVLSFSLTAQGAALGLAVAVSSAVVGGAVPAFIYANTSPLAATKH